MLPLSRLAVAVISGAVLAVGATSALAQKFPNKPIDFIVPSSSGSTSSLLARVVAAEMSKTIGQPIIVKDKPGANQLIGLQYIVREPADGYTVGVVGDDGVALLPLTTKNLSFDPLKDLLPIARLAESRYVLVSPADRPWKSFQELVAYAKANPGKLNYGSSVNQVQFPVLLLIRELGLNIVHIPYSGGASYLQAMVGGTLDLGITGESSAKTMGARVQVFAVTGKTRSANHPNVPTFTELNFPQVRGPTYSLSVHAGTPKAIIDTLTKAAATALKSPEIKQSMSNLLLEIDYQAPEDVAQRLAEKVKFYEQFAKDINFKAE